MAYQPIQMPHVGPYSGMETLRDALRQTQALNQHRARMLQDKEYRDQQMAMQQQQFELDRARAADNSEYQQTQADIMRRAAERQERMELSNAKQAALGTLRDRSLTPDQRIQQAAAMLQPYGLKLSELNSDPLAAATAPSALPAPNAQIPQGGSPMPDGIEFGQQQPPGLEPPPLQQPYTPLGQDPRDYTYAPDVESPERTGQMDASVPPLLQRPAQNPIEAARQQQLLQGLQRREALTGQPMPPGLAVGPAPGGGPAAPGQNEGRTYRFVGPDGQSFEVDPHAPERQAEEQRRQQLSQLAAMNEAAKQDPMLQRHWSTVRASIEAGTLPPEKAFDALKDLRRMDDEKAYHESLVDARKRRGTGSGQRKPNTRITTTDVQELSRLETDIKSIDDLIGMISQDPTVWDEYRANAEDWQRKETASKGAIYGGTRTLLQGAGIADVAPEQGLRSPEAKRLHMGMERTKNALAKSYGGVITDSDRTSAASEMATLGATPEEQIETLMRIRDKMATSRQLFIENKGVAPPSGAGDSGPRRTGNGGGRGAPPPAQRSADLEAIDKALRAPGLDPEKRARLEAMKARISGGR